MPKNIPGRADHAAPTDRSHIVRRVRKALVASCGAAAMVVSTGVLEENVEVVVNALLAIATVAGVYGTKNAPAAVAPPEPNLRAGR